MTAPSRKFPYRRCKACGKRYRDYSGEKLCKRPECKRTRKEVLDRMEVEKATRMRSAKPPDKTEAPFRFRYPRSRKDPDIARLERRAIQKRWEAKQEPSTLKAIRVHAWKAYSERKLAEDPGWQKKRYRRYREKILVKSKERYHRKKNEGKK